MSNEKSGTSWDVLETQLFAIGTRLLESTMQAAQARADQCESQLLADLLRRPDLAPRLAIEVTGIDGDRLTMRVLLHSRATGEPVARLFEIVAEGAPLPCLH